MKTSLAVVLFSLSIPNLAGAQAKPATTAAPAPATAPVKYGANPAAGQTFAHDGVTFYYEVYGQGEPLVIMHGNGGSIGDLARQIAFFRTRYRVIAMDSRDQGNRATVRQVHLREDDRRHCRAARSPEGRAGGRARLERRRHRSAAPRHPASGEGEEDRRHGCQPESGQGCRLPETSPMAKSMLAAIPAADRDTPEGRRALKVTAMMLEEPNIALKALEAITAPTLVLASDHDLISDAHTLEIFHHVPNSQLGIFPNATHLVPFDDPALFNATVQRFFRTPFVKKDRIKDSDQSLEKMKKAS